MTELVIAGGIVLVLVAVFGFAALIDDKRRARRLLRKPARTLASVTPGKAVTVAGRARACADPTVTLGGQPCVYTRIAVLQFFRKTKSDGAVSESWRVVAEQERGGPFQLADETGTVMVNPSGAVCVLEEQWSDVRWHDLSPDERELMARHEGNVTRGAPARIRQIVVWPDQPLTVHGTYRASAADAPGQFAAEKKTLLAIGSR